MDMQPHERIFVAVDTNDILKARALVYALKGKVGGFKVGLELITSMLVQVLTKNADLDTFVADLRGLFMMIGKDLFWDIKFADIPNTIGGASLGLALLSPKFFTVHASAATDPTEEDIGALQQAVKNKGTSKVLAVTLLTSIGTARCRRMFGAKPEVIVPRWALAAVDAGVDGLICSPADLERVNQNEKMINVPKMTPGIRPAFSQKNDQTRTMTPAEALIAGATWMVIGRPITQYPEGPAAAVERIVDEMVAQA